MQHVTPRSWTLAALCPILFALFSAPASGQGSNGCSTATPIAGTGTFNVNTVGATDSTQQTGSCPTAHCDVWFLWTAPTTDSFQVSLCGGTGEDTVLAVYPGPACPSAGTQLACNDDDCGVQSVVSFSAVAGNTYLLQMGDYYASTTYTGTFAVSVVAPPPPCGPNSGPDIIVGDLQDVANYTGATVGGVAYDAVAFGTYSCNIGTVWCNWIAGTNQHPVIDNNLYKYTTVSGATRIEQIGMSWLKHGFYALSDNLCCTGCQGTDGTHLGVRCSDPYTASRNGGQGGAGPRWQVNAASGVFTYPPANPTYSGTVARRCQVKVSDLEASSSSVHYFGEAQYVTQDDATAGNAYNNASYREVGVTGSGNAWTFSLIAPTVRENPAIRAWQALDPSVQIANVDIAGDGRVVVAWKVTNIGGGLWHYEYAVFNLNSDRSIQALSVPKGAGVSVTNIGFHDISYHDGDGPGDVNFDGTDWTPTNGASSVSWATSTFAQNPNANALRWGTMYNYRFNANVAPSSGSLTLSTFKTVGTTNVTVEVPGAPPPDGDGDGVPDSSDNCPGVANANQANADGDAFGDACDTCTDTDGDGAGNPGYPGNTCPSDGCPNDPNKTAPGQCGCGVPETDSDGDGTANCNDGCPNDPTKVAPGQCGCGVADTDSDGDGTANCHDGCPNDPLKIAPGACGCGVADTDSDGDGTANCNDGCPSDPLKTAPGQCGCGVADTDTDGDGTANCHDGCPNDPLKIAPGTCGCGVADTDSDGDGTLNCNDGCPSDPAKTSPGACGCGVPDTDTDGDGFPNCNDLCPSDPLKTAPGICGCGVADSDTDGDGTPNCNDLCPSDPSKVAPGACGCGVADSDTDGDGTPNCNDGCPNDPLKTAAGACGCGVADSDTDGDGTPNCNDGCPNDPLKTAAGACGCGVADSDSDGDGTPNCNDGCPNDPLKLTPGQCGCGVADTDSDGDGVANCNDGCPNDPLKLAPGLCGCGALDTDSDADGVADCVDNCPGISNSTQTDGDLDQVGDACDNCPGIANPLQGDCNQDQVGDACEIAAGSPDCNLNGVPDTCDIAGGASQDSNFNGIPDECENGVGFPFCFGDGSGPAACPCNNMGVAGRGCANSQNGAGALLSASGTTTPDTLVMTSSGELPNSSSILLQGSVDLAVPLIFGDGLRCVGGNLKRLYVRSASAGVVSFPPPAAPSISAQSALRGDPIAPGSTRSYQVYYRDPSATFCPNPPGNGWNVSGAQRVHW